MFRTIVLYRYCSIERIVIMKFNLRIIVLSLLSAVLLCLPVQADQFLDNLKPDQTVNGFRTVSLYDNASGQAMGARFINEKNGFIIDLLQIQSVPQAFFWVKTPVMDSRGEPHACEHLLLGKGNRGRYLSALEDMALGNSTASTGQCLTHYPFNTIAGEATFYEIFEARLQAFLNPDFTDEEIRREVCNLGVVVNPDDSSLALDEKGTVYTEMVSWFEQPDYYTYLGIYQLVYGKDHPLTYVSGGDPTVMRTMIPQNMWDFHKANYHLANMGAIVSVPSSIRVESFLKEIASILDRCRNTRDSSRLAGIGKYDFPKPDAAPAGTSAMVAYPSANAGDPGYLLYCWPADLQMDYKERGVLDLFLATFGNGETSDLYNLFVKSDTRKIDIGATRVSGGVGQDFGTPISFDINGVKNALVDQKMIDSVRGMIVEAVRTLHDYPDGSDQLREFNKRVRNRMIEARKLSANVLNQPPMFGFRTGPAGVWVSIMKDLEQVPGFRKSLVFTDAFNYADSLLSLDQNFWRDRIDAWHLLTVLPYAVGAIPDPNIPKANAAAKETRLADDVEALKKQYGVTDAQQAIAHYKADFDAKTAEIEASAAGFKMPGFIDNPPMTVDDQLDYKVITLAGQIPLVASTFENMTSSRVGLALRLDVIPESLIVYVPFVPSILNAIGVVKDGQVVTFDQMTERLRQEVLGFGSTYSLGLNTGRVELVLTGDGSNRTELLSALDWMNAALYTPYLSKDNLPRMLDRVDQLIQGNRDRIRSEEENWVDAPAIGYRFDNNPLIMSANCFFTRVHSLQRLRWMLTDPGDETSRQQLSSFLTNLETIGSGRSRADLTSLLTALENGTDGSDAAIGKELFSQYQALAPQAANAAKYAASSLRATLGDIPDANLGEDWVYLCRQARKDLMTQPEVALTQLNNILDLVRRTDNARMFMISNTADREAALPKIEALLGKLSKQRSIREKYTDTRRVVARLASREPGMTRPVYAGLVHEATQNGVLIFTSRLAGIYDTTTNAILNCLSGKMYGGSGPHGLFMKTWGAGLAYSNGFGIGQLSGWVRYYAERCPDAAETMRFVVNELKKAHPTPELVDYAIALAFADSRAPNRYEDRGQAMAADLTDGFTPEITRKYNEKLLALRKQPNLLQQLTEHMKSAYGPVLIGYDRPLAESNEGYFFLIGPETQFQSLEKYIASVESPQTVYRLYPRDFWLTM